jgi:hypothetical protein
MEQIAVCSPCVVSAHELIRECVLQSLVGSHPVATAAAAAGALAVSYGVHRIVDFLHLPGTLDRTSQHHGGELVAKVLKAVCLPHRYHWAAVHGGADLQ